MFGIKEFERVLAPEYYTVYENGLVALNSEKIEKDFGIKAKNLTRLDQYNIDGETRVRIRYYRPELFDETDRRNFVDGLYSYIRDAVECNG